MYLLSLVTCLFVCLFYAVFLTCSKFRLFFFSFVDHSCLR